MVWYKDSKAYVLSIITVIIILVVNVKASQDTLIKIDGSSTVYPITQGAIAAYEASENQPIEINAQFSGTSGGFRKFCQGETDINNASRPIRADEMELCLTNQVFYIELPIAFDALTIIVNAKNNWVVSLSTEELKKIWEPAAEGKITHWSQIKEQFPNETLTLYGAGRDSGTFDYFTEAIMGTQGSIRNDFIGSEDDDDIVAGVADNTSALGYVGLSYYEKHQDTLRAVAIDNLNGKGAVLPSTATVESALYQPLSRPLFVYISFKAVQNNPNLRKFIDFAFTNERAIEIVRAANYIPLTEESYQINRVTFHNGEVGTVFGGQSVFDLTLPELQRRQAEIRLESQ